MSDNQAAAPEDDPDKRKSKHPIHTKSSSQMRQRIQSDPINGQRVLGSNGKVSFVDLGLNSIELEINN